ncbi:uncharacterized protein TRIADDRAFT_62594 [Trichoplax adhaerens]|uniref:Uncharacterized protein n=1 Tax=Trichoplax adhaerens TaxID=10228 RepID=B3SE97_TRIAD|nr:predicted protein [Trichoplax adhaerens]EDV18948.1 predicted protein [Trichoplax adhaerens]|eukprot:XP_002118566.1 predicted protein [Trichoplax adhaerens]
MYAGFAIGPAVFDCYMRANIKITGYMCETCYNRTLDRDLLGIKGIDDNYDRLSSFIRFILAVFDCYMRANYEFVLKGWHDLLHFVTMFHIASTHLYIMEDTSIFSREFLNGHEHPEEFNAIITWLNNNLHDMPSFWQELSVLHSLPKDTPDKEDIKNVRQQQAKTEVFRRIRGNLDNYCREVGYKYKIKVQIVAGIFRGVYFLKKPDWVTNNKRMDVN